jgi:hypothetical protein
MPKRKNQNDDQRQTQERETADMTPDQRMQYDQLLNEQRSETRARPAPYDLAPEGTPDEQVITKGKREKPGPTGDATFEPEAARPNDLSTGDLGGDGLNRAINDQTPEGSILAEDEDELFDEEA